jgi:hypothetical protein
MQKETKPRKEFRSRVRINQNTYAKWVVSFRDIAVCDKGYVWERKTIINMNGVKSRRFTRLHTFFDESGYMVAKIKNCTVRVYALVYEAYCSTKAPKNLEVRYINKDNRDHRVCNLTFNRRIKSDLYDFPGGVKLQKSHEGLRPFGGYQD